MALSLKDREEISLTIRTVVNGNIKRVEEKLDAHVSNHDRLIELVENLQPVSDLVGWVNTTRRIVFWVTGIVIAIGGAVTILK